MPSAKVSPSTIALKQESIDPSNNSRALRSQPTTESNDSYDNFASEMTGI